VIFSIVDELDGAAVRFTSNTVSGNTSLDQFCEDCATGTGGGLYASGALVIENSTFSANTAARRGGAVFLAGTGVHSLINSTISGNSAAYTGGVYSSSPASFLNVTVANNTATDAEASGAGLAGGDEAPVSLRNTIVSGNQVVGLGLRNCSGRIVSEGHNLEDGDTCDFNAVTGDGDLINTNPLLGPLAENGGDTRTHALLEASPAIDAGDNTAGNCPALDQRGTTRPLGAACDIGSFEAVTALAADIIVLPGTNRLPIRLSDRHQIAITVTVLGSATLNAGQIVPASLTLGDGRGTDAGVLTLRGIPIVVKLDVDRDGDIDAVATFTRQALVSAGDLTTATTKLVLRGALRSGQKIRGERAVQVSP
jgi:hypothetical protein